MTNTIVPVPPYKLTSPSSRTRLLYPPSRTPLSTQPAASWFHQLTSDHEGLACTQHAGDVLFVPPYWGHTTVRVCNATASVGWTGADWGMETDEHSNNYWSRC